MGMKVIKTADASQTEKIAEIIGGNLHGGEVIELVSDLGGGKTTFTRGLAKGFGSTDRVASPTFTISKVYKSGNKEMHHFDFYRLPQAGLIEHELADVLTDKKCVVVVEWADVVKHVLPAKRLTINFRQTQEDGRELNIKCADELSYLMEGLPEA
ncbi:MAG: tRNA threonylcarbamoyladenosine biosynthesis protein TsaE [Patescibacteria group bacterium]|nr:tRNA threonylcarbamoyladenosine biosynthesis protein TsaE [Patescibacteria group bacterium]